MGNRIDKEMVIRGLAPSRTKAQELIKLNLVFCNGKTIPKSNFIVQKSDNILLKKNDKLKYVSRGGLKLEKAIKEFDINFNGLKVMDIGSSTGGFCDCALQHGAASIIAIDVGTDLLHETLRNNKLIDLHEQTNFKYLDNKYFADINIILCDVSFISMKQIIKKIASVKIKIDFICLIKPQFECGKEIASKYKGVILNKKIHIHIIKNILDYSNSLGFYMKNIVASPIRGGDGNIEYLIYLTNKENKNSNINIKNIVIHAFEEE